MVAVIAGTGMENIGSWRTIKEHVVVTKHGRAVLYEVDVAGRNIYFLPRHGSDHSTSPHLINHKANIAALEKLGVKKVVAICSVGSLSIDISPGSLVLLQDFISMASGVIYSFFSEPDSPVVHMDMSSPYCHNEREVIKKVCKELGIDLVGSGTYVGVQGPRYETPAEVRAFRFLGGDVVGMTNVPECVLAREAGLCYAAIAIVTNLGTGLDTIGLEHAEVVRAAQSILPSIEQILYTAIPELDDLPDCCCQSNTANIL